MKPTSLIRFGLLNLFLTARLFAQVQPAEADADANAVPLTLEQNYAWSLHQMFDPGSIFFVAARAAMDHSANSPSRWGQGASGLAMRAGSHMARSVVRENLAFGIRALDHEDPRYFHSHAKGAWRRTRYAASRALVARSENGGNMPAYSTLVASFATPFIAQTWRPEPIGAGRELRSGAMGVGFSAAGNICQEFWPDIRKKLRRP